MGNCFHRSVAPLLWRTRPHLVCSRVAVITVAAILNLADYGHLLFVGVLGHEEQQLLSSGNATPGDQEFPGKLDIAMITNGKRANLLFGQPRVHAAGHVFHAAKSVI